MKNNEINYGALTEVSRELNKILGDKSGKTISRRTTHGFKKLFKLTDMDISDENAEHIVHGIMIATIIALNNKGTRVTGMLMLVGLFLFYHAGE